MVRNCKKDPNRHHQSEPILYGVVGDFYGRNRKTYIETINLNKLISKRLLIFNVIIFQSKETQTSHVNLVTPESRNLITKE